MHTHMVTAATRGHYAADLCGPTEDHSCGRVTHLTRIKGELIPFMLEGKMSTVNSAGDVTV